MVGLERVERLRERAGHLGDVAAGRLEEVVVGRGPGSGPRSIPSMPAISIAANARYGFAAASGQRNSIRLAFGDSEYIGMRMHAERFRCEYTRLTGAS